MQRRPQSHGLRWVARWSTRRMCAAVMSGGVMAVALATSACSTAPRPESEPVGTVQLPDGSAVMTVETLRSQLLRYTDVVIAEMRRLSVGAPDNDPTPTERAYLQRVQADVAAVALALSIGPDPESSLQGLMASMTVKRRWVDDLPLDSIGSEVRERVVDAMTRLDKEIWDIGSGLYTQAELGDLRGRVDAWWAETSPRPPAGVVRVDELPNAPASGMSKGLFSGIAEANRQVAEARLLGERFLFLAERLPTITLWQTESAAWEAANAPASRSALASISVMSEAVAILAARVDSLPMLMDDQREAFLSAFDEREANLTTLLSETGDVVRDAAPLLESSERVAGLGSETALRLSETLEATERLLLALRDVNAPGGAVSLDIEAYTGAIDDVRASTEALNEALSRVEGLVGEPAIIIDHLVWRLAQLILLIFGLVVAYRLAMPRLAAKGGKQ
jgi:hypothetical protein